MPLTPVSILNPDDAAYPPLVRAALPVPAPLYAVGTLSVAQTPCISIIGSRIMSAYGEAVCRFLVPPLVQAGLTIVSGLAYGVDSYVHRLALKQGGSCLAVLGSGTEHVYPQVHQTLAESMVQAGGLILTEYAPPIIARPFHFLARNRIIAALSQVVLIIEAGAQSGTLNTAAHALEMGREVCVVPADITRTSSAGSLALLKQGARPVTSAADILALYEAQPIVIAERLRPALTGSLAALYDAISCGTTTTDALHQATGYPLAELHSVLSVLELDGYVCYKDNQWQTIL